MPYSAEVYEQLRRATGENDVDSTYEDSDLDFYLDEAGGDVNQAAGKIWREKASQYAELVDITEAGSSRKNSTLYESATKQAEFYEGESTPGGTPEPGTYSTTRAIVRPS